MSPVEPVVYNALATCVGKMWLARVEGFPDLLVRVRWRPLLRRMVKRDLAAHLGCPPSELKIRLYIGAPRSAVDTRRAPRGR